MIWLAATGLLSILGQVVLLRELGVASFGIELVYVVGLGVWMVASAAGAILPERRTVPSRAPIAAATLAASLLVPLGVVLLRASRVLPGDVPGAYLSLPRQLAAAVVALAPLAATLGWLFRRAAALHASGGGRLARAYAVESAGALAGGAASLALSHLGASNVAQALLTSAAGAGAVLLAAPLLPGRARVQAVAVAVASIALLIVAPAGDRAMTRWTHPGLVDSIDTPYARVTATRRLDQVAVFENDAILFESAGVEGDTLGHLAALHHPNPRRVLLLGGVGEGVLPALAAHQPRRIDHVELDRLMYERVRRQLGPELREKPAGTEVTTEFADPRRVLARGDAYDLVVVALAGPSTAQSNRYYTREFFAEARASLAPGGLLVFRLQMPENAWTPPETALAGSVWKALGEAFPHRTLLPPPASVLIASADALPDGAAPLVARYQRRGIRARLAGVPFIRYIYENERRRAVPARLDLSPVAANRDARPACYRIASWIWLSKFIPGLGSALPGAGRSPWLALAAILALAVPVTALWMRARSPGAARPVLLVSAGAFAGMLVESVLMLDYQARVGVLYQDMGALLTAFMAGLAAGALAVDRRSGRGAVGRREGAAILALLAATTAASLAAVILRVPMDLLGFTALLAASGAGVGALFAYASLDGSMPPGARAGWLYAGDLAGGAVAALAGSLVLIPELGLASAAAVALAAIAACLLLL